MSDYQIRPNAKTRLEDIEVTCYGREMIMVDHPVFGAPRPLGPTVPEDFWEEYDDHERVHAILDFLDSTIDWAESDVDAFLTIGQDIDDVREELQAGDPDT